MTTAAEIDTYLLPEPTPGTPVILDRHVRAMHAESNARFEDPVWPLAALSENPSRPLEQIHWRRCPPSLQPEVRRIAWTMINGELRPTFLAARGTRFRARTSISKIKETVQQWMYLATWLDAQSLCSLALVTREVWCAYGQHLIDRDTSRDRIEDIFISLTRLWAFDLLSAHPSGISRPPWDKAGMDEFLPPARSRGGENETEPIAEATMAPLLVWATRMVEDFADDILAAHAETERLATAARTNPTTDRGQSALRAFLDPLLANGGPLPATVNQGRVGFARAYTGGLTGASRHQVACYVEEAGLVTAASRRPGPCPLPIPVHGRIEGRGWRDALDFNETPGLVRHLATACFIVIAYLTGMRPGEILGLRTGCCPPPNPDDPPLVGWHHIRSRAYKSATDERGNHLSAGVERDTPWVAITPVVNAIRVLERLVPEGQLLFNHTVHGGTSRHHRGALRSKALAERIEDFIAWANHEATAQHLPQQTIPPDPAGPIATQRFRRTLAWHIARRPGGLVALAIQYGHLETALASEGYASRSRGGIHDLIDIETVRAVADTLAQLNDHLADGTGISGPAARRAIKAAAHAPRFEGTIVNATTARRLLANDDALLYDNPRAFLLCHYKRDQALCHRDDLREMPRLDHCVPSCGNIVRTDQHANALRARAAVLDEQAAHVPGPVGERLRVRADRLRALADAHERTRTTLKGTTP
ncbi:integrase [Streptomyces sp. NPDC102384]|uniref:integrase n=1 Tax=Streptomyces sp. NPDC102384 TaxID=3366166 RepID=UPI00382B12CD